MRFGIPLLADRVAPRCTFADSVLVVSVRGRRIRDQAVVPLNGTTWADLVEALTSQAVDTLICGGISPTTRESIRSRDVEVIENVAGTREEIVTALGRGKVRSGFGLAPEPGNTPNTDEARVDSQTTFDHREEEKPEVSRPLNEPSDCLECTERICLRGEPCPFLEIGERPTTDEQTRLILESTWDVALEEERTLCRIAELVYFALEMGYRRIGVAFCEELREPAAILTGVLRRFFEVVPVSCKAHQEDPENQSESEWKSGEQALPKDVPCDPQAVAAVLDSKSTELNVVVGFCVGADCIFNKNSRAPVTTIFVKDKSLANNPIGAVYSHYYLTEI